MKSTKGIFIQNLKQACKFFDLYGQNVNLFIDKKSKLYTTFSGLISIAVIGLIIYTFTGFITSWLNKEKMTLIPSSISYSTIELLTINQNYEYEFNFKNYYIYWVITAILPDGTAFNTQDLKSYFSYNVTYTSELNLIQELPTEPCIVSQQDEFLGLGEAKIRSDQGKTAPNRICIKNGIKMGLFPDASVNSIRRPGFYFSVYPCSNSTKNNNSCAPQEKINDMIQYTYVQTSMPTTVYDFNNVKRPQKNIYDYRYTFLDKTMMKYYMNQVTTYLLYSDDGLVSEDYKLQATNFNPNVNYDPNIRNPDNPLFKSEFYVSMNFQIYFLKNLKLNELAGNLGGLVNAIFLLGKVFCLSYNSLYLRFKIINSTFSLTQFKRRKSEVFPKINRNKLGARSSFSAKISRKFSYFTYLFPSKEVREFYEKGSKHLHEYLDIRKIIKRLQDLDKLKLILFKEDQRKLFEYIPKPNIADSTHRFSIGSILKYENKVKTKENLANVWKLLAEDNDPMNKRILECIDQKLDYTTEVTDKEGNLLFFD